MILSYKSLDRISFPIYKLPSDNWYTQDGLVYIDGQLLDDRNMPGETIGIRRMQSPFRDRFMRLGRAIETRIGIFKQDKRFFVDNRGNPFIYEKTKVLQLRYLPIKKVERKDIASLLWVRGCKKPFRIPRPPEPEMAYAGILFVQGAPWTVYEYSETKRKDTLRKI